MNLQRSKSRIAESNWCATPSKYKRVIREAPSIKQVEISLDVLERLNHHRQFQYQNEAGGILIGRRYIDHLLIERITEPGPRDQSGRMFFERDATSAQLAINEAWKKSNGTHLYLGEWHTHPEPFPTPSLRDRKMIASMFEGTQPRYGPLLLLIVGTRGFWLGCQTEKLSAYHPVGNSRS